MCIRDRSRSDLDPVGPSEPRPNYSGPIPAPGRRPPGHNPTGGPATARRPRVAPPLQRHHRPHTPRHPRVFGRPDRLGPATTETAATAPIRPPAPRPGEVHG